MIWRWWQNLWQRTREHEDSPYPSMKPYLSPPGRRRKIPANSLERYYIPLSVMEATDQIFRRFGTQQRETYAWWTGYATLESEAQVCTVLYSNVASSYGHVHLGRNTISAMHRRLIEMDQVLLAELHTHPPGAGGQNMVDADNAACYYPGFVTIVVPDFGSPRFYDLRDCHVYAYGKNGSWRDLSREEISQRFIIEEQVVEVKSK